MTSGSILIVGGTSGLGLECARALAVDGSRREILLTSPVESRARSAAGRLATAGAKCRLRGLGLRLESPVAVRQFAERLRGLDVAPLRAVLFNAAIQLTQIGPCNEQGVELIFAVNHLGHFLLANLLLGQIEPPARLLFVSSATHDPQRRAGVTAPPYPGVAALARPPALSGDDKARREAAGLAYASSKLCNLLCAYELERRLEAGGLSTREAPITVNCYDPGLMPGTALARSYGPLFRFVWHRLLPPLARFVPGMSTPARSGRDLAWLLTDPGLDHVSGKYFVGREPQPSSAESYDERKAADLWSGSAELVGLSSDESPVAGGPAGKAAAG